MRRNFVAALVAAAWPCCALANEPVLSGVALQETVAGKTVMLETPLGGLPISYRADGTMSGHTKELAVYTGSERDSGTWWVSRDKLCQRWAKWLDGKSYCFTLRKEGRVVHWTRNDGQSGRATIAR
jgi:hypothetical protein